MILIRSHMVDAELLSLAERLGELAGKPVGVILDERNGPADAGGLEKISLTQRACESLGLHCPEDFAWRCGDYGLYLARKRFPMVRHFWLIESDVRIGGWAPEALFTKYMQDEVDFVGSHLRPPPDPWHWGPSVRSRDAVAMTCFFPVLRISETAIDVLLEKRRAHSQIWTRRRLWPNDEAFVATTLVQAGLSYRDLNDGEPQIYDESDFAFDSLRDGSLPLNNDRPVALFHPVLTGEAYARKKERLATRRKQRGPIEHFLFRINRKIGINAIASRINGLRAW